MARQKYDWAKIKADFLASDIDEVKEFIGKIWGRYNRNCSQATKGRAKEKKEMKERIIREAIEENIRKEVDSLEIPIWQLKAAKKTVLWLVMKKLNKIIEKEKKDEENEEINLDNIDIKEQERMLRMIKTELWEPTSISKTDATIKWEPLDESLFIND